MFSMFFKVFFALHFSFSAQQQCFINILEAAMPIMAPMAVKAIQVQALLAAIIFFIRIINFTSVILFGIGNGIILSQKMAIFNYFCVNCIVF